MTHHRQVAEEVARIDERQHPQQAANQVERQEARVGHGSHAGHEGGKGTHYGQETGDDDGLAAMLGIEGVGLDQIVAAEDLRIGIAKQLIPEEVAYGVVHHVAEHGGDDQHPRQGMHIQHAAHGEGACGKQQGVAGQEGGHHQAGLTEDDEEQDGVNPDAIVLEQLFQVHVNVQNKVDCKQDQIHFLIPMK
ncbi:hypothetical protein D3C75_997440 [compost metagenome]